MIDLPIRRCGLLASEVLTIAAAAALPQSPSASSSTRPFAPVPLAFDTAAIRGLSELSLTSHHDSNDVGTVRRLGQITQAFAAIVPSTTSGFSINGLKREKRITSNSMILHELCFLDFGEAIAHGAAFAPALERDYDSYDRWRAEFIAMGKALGGGSERVLLIWSARDGRLNTPAIR